MADDKHVNHWTITAEKEPDTYEASEHFIDEGTEGPPINFFVVALTAQHFGGNVLGWAAEGVCFGVKSQSSLAQSKINEANVTLHVEQQVLGLEIAIHNVVVVQIAEGQHHFSSVESSAVFAEVIVAREVIEQFTAIEVIDHHVQVQLGLKGVFEIDQERVVDVFQNLVLCHGVLDCITLDHVVFANHFHREDVARVFLAHLKHFAKTTLAHHGEDFKVIGAYFLHAIMWVYNDNREV